MSPWSGRLKCCAMFNTILQFSPMNKIDYKWYNSANISIFLSATEPGLHSHQELHSQFCHLGAQISYFFLLVHCQYSVWFTSWYTSVVFVLDYWKLSLPECTEVERGIETRAVKVCLSTNWWLFPITTNTNLNAALENNTGSVQDK